MANKTVLIIFMLVIVVACVLAYYGKAQQIKAEREWKDAIMSSQLTLAMDNDVDHAALRSEVEIVREAVKNVPVGMQRSEVEALINERLTPTSVVAAYSPTAYCVTHLEDAGLIRLDCKKFP